jgi:hypothetical protein
VDTALAAALIAGIVAILAAIMSAFATLRVGAIRKGLQVQIAIPRVEAYRTLWDLTKSGSAGHILEQSARADLDAQLFEWYYTNGNGIFLSNRSRDLLQHVQRSLTTAGAEWDAIATQLGLLRSSLRSDVGIFGSDDLRRRRRHVPR